MRGFYLLPLVGLASAGLLTLARAAPPEDAHYTEELGVNEYTAPLIAGVFGDLDTFDPVQLAAQRRKPPNKAFPDRAQLALNLGETIGEGFLAASTRDQSSVEQVARALIKQSEALAVSGPLKKRGRSLLELALRGSWVELRAELTAAQSEVEATLVELKDEEVSHLIGLGGWLRGLEVTSRLSADDYTEARARELDRIGLVDYYYGRVQTLNPQLREQTLFRQIDARLGELRRLLLKEGPPDREEVARMATITRELNEQIAKPME